MCTLLSHQRRRDGPRRHHVAGGKEPPCPVPDGQNKLDFSTGAREPQFQARGEGRPSVPAAGVGAVLGWRYRRSGGCGLAPKGPLASKGPLDSSWDPERSRDAPTSSLDGVIRDLSRMELERVFPTPVSTGRASVLWRSARWLFWAAAWGHRSNTRTGNPS